MRRVIVLLAVVGLALMAGCLSSGGSAEAVQDETTIEDKPYVDRFIDEEAGVVCYTFDSGPSGGLSCVPLNQTDL